VEARDQQLVVRVQQARAQQEKIRIQQSRWSSIQQSEDKLDQEIELITKLMEKVSQKKIAARKQRSRSSSNK
ncbi:hypothetical protein, partial [Bacteroides uniformis]|uniref:hypothetical protein n=1 Tax=Bacteroides uniformis TaxID=820 RepID=UPI001AA143D7